MTTVQGYFYAWRDMGLFAAMNHLPAMSARELEGREAKRRNGCQQARCQSQFFGREAGGWNILI